MYPEKHYMLAITILSSISMRKYIHNNSGRCQEVFFLAIVQQLVYRNNSFCFPPLSCSISETLSAIPNAQQFQVSRDKERLWLKISSPFSLKLLTCDVKKDLRKCTLKVRSLGGTHHWYFLISMLLTNTNRETAKAPNKIRRIFRT